MWKVAGAPPNNTGAPGRTICVIAMPVKYIDAVEHQRTDHGYRGNQSPSASPVRSRSGIPSLDTVEQILAGVLLRSGKLPVAVIVKDRHRLCEQLSAIRSEQLHHLCHAGNAASR